jgi:hypothetical protein
VTIVVGWLVSLFEPAPAREKLAGLTWSQRPREKADS